MRRKRFEGKKVKTLTAHAYLGIQAYTELDRHSISPGHTLATREKATTQREIALL